MPDIQIVMVNLSLHLSLALLTNYKVFLYNSLFTQ